MPRHSSMRQTRPPRPPRTPSRCWRCAAARPTPGSAASGPSMPGPPRSASFCRASAPPGASNTVEGGSKMKKFVNDPRQFVAEMLEGIHLASDGRLKYEPKYNLIYRADMPRADKVSIIQGSGSGHEPAHTMIVGKGMLDAACPGDVFAGPPVDFVYETSKLLNSPKGVLHIVNDDVAVKDSTWTVGRRGVAGNFFVIKAVGAASENGADLDELVRIGNKVIAGVRSLGIALSSCTPPVKGSPLFEIADDEMEIGIGIHGEPGRQRTKMVSANEIVDLMLDAVVPDLPFESGDEVAVMINGLGGTTIGELYLLYGIAHKKLEAKGIKVFRSYVNEYCTSLEMAGASLTLLKVDDELKHLLNEPAEVSIRVF